jgi:hypothetical protein
MASQAVAYPLTAMGTAKSPSRLHAGEVNTPRTQERLVR